jgi:hypothetical protein
MLASVGCAVKWMIRFRKDCFELSAAQAMFWTISTNGGPQGNAQVRGRSLVFRLTAWDSTASFLLVAVATALLYCGLSTNLRRSSERLLADEMDV